MDNKHKNEMEKADKITLIKFAVTAIAFIVVFPYLFLGLEIHKHSKFNNFFLVFIIFLSIFPDVIDKLAGKDSLISRLTTDFIFCILVPFLAWAFIAVATISFK
ncbi:MAG: hypothetical protein Q4A06_04625 [Cardiobacteriaceae bacterium]|nr:hypothetical protein [Cardiobacteriaceae bacterium]